MSTDATTDVKPTYFCRSCKVSFNFKRELLLHRKTEHSNQNDTPYICEICNKGFANHGNMYRHMKSHSNIRPHACNICGKTFAQNVNLQRHYSVHNGERPFSCVVCHKSFTQQGNLKRHELIHTGEKPFRCKRCGRMFSQRVNLKKHVMMHQGFRPFSCDICGKSFLQSQNYRKHMQRHEEKEATKPGDTDVYYECGICSTVFDNFVDFQSHEIFCEVANEEQIETTTATVTNTAETVIETSSTDADLNVNSASFVNTSKRSSPSALVVNQSYLLPPPLVPISSKPSAGVVVRSSNASVGSPTITKSFVATIPVAKILSRNITAVNSSNTNNA